jgi:hypothetical protein
MHAVSKGIVEVAFNKEQLPHVLNFSHPRPVRATDLMFWFRDELVKVIPSLKGRLQMLPLAECASLLEEQMKANSDINLETSVGLLSTENHESLILSPFFSLTASSQNYRFHPSCSRG